MTCPHQFSMMGRLACRTWFYRPDQLDSFRLRTHRPYRLAANQVWRLLLKSLEFAPSGSRHRYKSPASRHQVGICNFLAALCRFPTFTARLSAML